MPQQSDLVGAGLPPLPAALLGNQATSLAGAGTTQATAAAILSHLVKVTGSGSNTGAILPAAALVGTQYFVASLASGSPAVVYAPVGHTLNGTTNGKYTFATAVGMAVFIKTGSTEWWCFPSASTGAVT